MVCHQKLVAERAERDVGPLAEGLGESGELGFAGGEVDQQLQGMVFRRHGTGGDNEGREHDHVVASVSPMGSGEHHPCERPQTREREIRPLRGQCSTTAAHGVRHQPANRELVEYAAQTHEIVRRVRVSGNERLVEHVVDGTQRVITLVVASPAPVCQPSALIEGGALRAVNPAELLQSRLLHAVSLAWWRFCDWSAAGDDAVECELELDWLRQVHGIERSDGVLAATLGVRLGHCARPMATFESAELQMYATGPVVRSSARMPPVARRRGDTYRSPMTNTMLGVRMYVIALVPTAGVLLLATLVGFPLEATFFVFPIPLPFVVWRSIGLGVTLEGKDVIVRNPWRTHGVADVVGVRVASPRSNWASMLAFADGRGTIVKAWATSLWYRGVFQEHPGQTLRRLDDSFRPWVATHLSRQARFDYDHLSHSLAVARQARKSSADRP